MTEVDLPKPDRLKYELSDQEHRVVDFIMEGLSNTEIGNKLFITTKTVKFHLTNIYKKLGVTNRNALFYKILRAKDCYLRNEPYKQDIDENRYLLKLEESMMRIEKNIDKLLKDKKV